MYYKFIGVFYHALFDRFLRLIFFQLSVADDIPMIVKKEEDDNDKERLLFVGETKTVRQERYRIENGEVIISNVVRADAGPYLCYYQDNDDLKIRHFVEVQYPPKVISISPLERKVPKGSSVTLECTADGNPMPKIIWSKEGGRLPSGAESEEGLSMTLEGVDRHVEGRYTCTADNGVGEPASQTSSIAVEYPPEIITEKVRMCDVMLAHELVNMLCVYVVS